MAFKTIYNAFHPLLDLLFWPPYFLTTKTQALKLNILTRLIKPPPRRTLHFTRTILEKTRKTLIKPLIFLQRSLKRRVSFVIIPRFRRPLQQSRRNPPLIGPLQISHPLIQKSSQNLTDLLITRKFKTRFNLQQYSFSFSINKKLLRVNRVL